MVLKWALRRIAKLPRKPDRNLTSDANGHDCPERAAGNARSTPSNSAQVPG
jgi:hypothetical protein